MHTILVVVHLFLAIGVIGLVLMQHGKGADAGAAFGSGASGTVFGARGSANFLSRSTAILATLFFVTSLALAWFAMKATDRGGLMDKMATPPAVAVEKPETAVPAIPGIAAPEAKSNAVPAIPEGKPAEVPVEATAAKPEGGVAAAQVEGAPQAAAPAQDQPQASATEPKASEQVPAKSE